MNYNQAKGDFLMIKNIFIGLTALFLFVSAFFNISNAMPISAPYWNKSSITVYVPSDKRAEQMKRAFAKWQSVSSGKLKFIYQNSDKTADIIVKFTKTVDNSDNPIASYSLTTQNGIITKAEIQLATNSNEISKYTNNYIYTTMLHEIGHVLGLSNTTRKSISIMNHPVVETQNITRLDIMHLFKLNNWSWSERAPE